ncbi:alanine racemase [Clostridiaceae bacterium]|nr:alanine racemase [Clostridiaceae bacterium]RKI15568.1 alanine racemase [bacterium 1XD21-70]
MKEYTRVFAEIDLDAVVFNIESMKKNLAPGTGLVGVVKADGYGHGSVPVARAIAPYVEAYAVATAEEALLLHRHGVRKPVLVLGPVHKSHYKSLAEHGIRPVIFTLEQAKELSKEAVRQKRTADFHLAVDTGMSRIGLDADETGAGLAVEICSLPGIRAEGIFTHFARADEEDKNWSDAQLACFLHFVKMLEERGLQIPVKHCANSAAIIDMPKTGLDWARAGISLYGMYPSGEVAKEAVPLQPVMRLKSFVTYVKEIAPGRPVSYGGTFVAEEPMRVATVPVGYGDGYPRNLSGRGFVLIRGQKAPILGRVCMDQLMVDVTRIADVGADTKVTLIGREGDNEIRVEDLAEWGGGFHYEIVCDIGKRVPRVYLRGNEAVGSKDYFEDVYPEF